VERIELDSRQCSNFYQSSSALCSDPKVNLVSSLQTSPAVAQNAVLDAALKRQ